MAIKILLLVQFIQIIFIEVNASESLEPIKIDNTLILLFI